MKALVAFLFLAQILFAEQTFSEAKKNAKMIQPLRKWREICRI
ncbi:hypothetical protein [Helicobacter ganmani]